MKAQRGSQSSRPARWCRWLAVGTGVALLVGSGAGYRLAAARLNRLAGDISLPRGALARLPLHIANWDGRDVPLDERIVRATDTDAHVNRTYEPRGGGQAVSLFLGFGVRFRDLMPHRPEVCYPGAGWTLDQRRPVELKAADGSALPCQIHHFRRGGFRDEHVTVLNYYLVDGQRWPDVSLLRSKAWRTASARYVAQVQVSSGDDRLDGAAEGAVCRFAADSAAEIRTLLANATGTGQSTQPTTND